MYAIRSYYAAGEPTARQATAAGQAAAASAWTAYNAASPDFSVDATAPSVTSTVPVNTATGVTTNSQVTISFDAMYQQALTQARNAPEGGTQAAH